MKVIVSPSSLEGEVKAPPSKSLMQRVALAVFLAEEGCLISNPCLSDDCIAMLNTLGEMGAVIERRDGGLFISGKPHVPDETITCGESGLGTRLIIPFLASFGYPSTISAEGSLKDRTMAEYLKVLPNHGVKIQTAENGALPWTIQGPLRSGNYELDGGVSSQFLSGLLMILPTLEGDSIIKVNGLKSKPYVDMTLEVLEYFGVEVMHKDYEEFRIPGGQRYQNKDVFVDGDWSSAASLMCAVAASSSRDAVRIDEIGGNFSQADQMIAGALLFAGCRIHREENNYLLYPGKLKGFRFDASDCPDLVPVLAALAVFAKGPSTFSGISRLRHKESDRATVIQKEFQKAGIKVELSNDELTVHPGKVQSCTIDPHNDHRIAMAGAVLGIGGATITVTHAECVGKSYPEFWEDLHKLGAQIKIDTRP